MLPSSADAAGVWRRLRRLPSHGSMEKVSVLELTLTEGRELVCDKNTRRCTQSFGPIVMKLLRPGSEMPPSDDETVELLISPADCCATSSIAASAATTVGGSPVRAKLNIRSWMENIMLSLLSMTSLTWLRVSL